MRHLRPVKDGETLPPPQDRRVYQYKGHNVTEELYTLLCQREALRKYLDDEISKTRSRITVLSAKISDQADEEGFNLSTLKESGTI